MHINTHKTFSTPHGGGGPGAGPVGGRREARAVPAGPARPARGRRDVPPRAGGGAPDARSGGCARSSAAPACSCARMPTCAPTARAACAEITDDAVLAANYLKDRLADSGAYDIPFPGVCKHEFIASATSIKKQTGVRTLDIAKRLLDHGFHAPTMYFPLTVDEAMLIEPTETESHRDARRVRGRPDRDRARGRDATLRRSDGAAHRARAPPRRGGRGPAIRTCAGVRQSATGRRVRTDARAVWPAVWARPTCLTRIGRSLFFGRMVGRSLRQIVWARLRRDKVAMICLVVVVAMYAIAIVGPFCRRPLGVDPYKFDAERDQRPRRQAQSAERRDQPGAPARRRVGHRSRHRCPAPVRPSDLARDRDQRHVHHRRHRDGDRDHRRLHGRPDRHASSGG